MPTKTVATIFLSVVLPSAAALAGEFEVSKDDFDGSVTRQYRATEAEFASQEVLYVIRDYDPNDGTVFFAVSPASGATGCDDKYLLLKSADDVIHKIDADEKSPDICFARIPAAWIKTRFAVRIPMWSGPSRDAKFNTATLDLSQIKK